MHHSHSKLALITGASSGIGLELAKCFADHGYDLIMVSDNQDKLNHAAEEIHAISDCKIEIIEADLSKEGGAPGVYAEVQKRGLKIGVLVNNAGVGVYGKFATTSLEEELSMIHLNVISVVTLTKLFVNDMLRHGGGKILVTSSVAALAGTPYLTVYGATKAFEFNFVQGLREELKDSNITVTALLPSETDTNFFHRAHMEESKITAGKLADPAVVAKAGFEALMHGDSYVASPMKAKVMDILSHILPEDSKSHIGDKKHQPKH